MRPVCSCGLLQLKVRTSCSFCPQLSGGPTASLRGRGQQTGLSKRRKTRDIVRTQSCWRKSIVKDPANKRIANIYLVSISGKFILFITILCLSFLY